MLVAFACSLRDDSFSLSLSLSLSLSEFSRKFEKQIQKFEFAQIVVKMYV
ncbi:hypothetical protein OAV88_03240 [bacterium]|nr:hypothetical protein [bacterium]